MIEGRILVHVCCAPCASYVVDLLKDKDLTLVFYNPNIMPFSEHEKRYLEIEKLAKIYEKNLIKLEYDNNRYLEKVEGLEYEKEKGSRCSICYQMRLERLVDMTPEYDAVITTLTLSPHKNTDEVNRIGRSLFSNYIETNFKKNDGFKKSIELSKKYNIYRQNYCGCRFD